MTRKKNWPVLLSEFIERRRFEPFCWGRQDCCIFAADWILLATGEDLAAKWRGTYSGMCDGLRHVKKVGGVHHFPQLMGLDRVERAQRGDLAGIATPLGLALGVCLGKKSAYPGHDGLVFVDRIMIRKAWRV
jgi:hypothetical protein